MASFVPELPSFSFAGVAISLVSYLAVLNIVASARPSAVFHSNNLHEIGIVNGLSRCFSFSVLLSTESICTRSQYTQVLLSGPSDQLFCTIPNFYKEQTHPFKHSLQSRTRSLLIPTIADSSATADCQVHREVTGNQPTRFSELHEKYGPIVRTAPDELSYIIDAWQDIYVSNFPNHVFPYLG
jgi:hypothetical protein